jgi:hypothetical protein
MHSLGHMRASSDHLTCHLPFIARAATLSATPTTSSETVVFITSHTSHAKSPPAVVHCHSNPSCPTRLSTLTDYSHLSITPTLPCVLLRLASQYLLNRNLTEGSTLGLGESTFHFYSLACLVACSTLRMLPKRMSQLYFIFFPCMCCSGLC